MSDLLEFFGENGYAIFPATDIRPLMSLRLQIFEKALAVFGGSSDDPEEYFNQFHALSIDGPALNEQRVQLIHACNSTIDSSALIFDAFRGPILDLLGPDLLVQKNTNLVIQQPHDPNPTEMHRDAPANSPYEIVVWLPLVDCCKTKTMNVLDLSHTKKATQELNKDEPWESFVERCNQQAISPDVPFGTALIFWTALFHSTPINVESETRWSLNVRYKNLFSPNGMKDPFEFFKIFKLSPLTQLGLAFEKEDKLGTDNGSGD